MTLAERAAALGVDLHDEVARPPAGRFTNARLSSIGYQMLHRKVTVNGRPLRKQQRVWVSQHGPSGCRIHLTADARTPGLWVTNPKAVSLLDAGI